MSPDTPAVGPGVGPGVGPALDLGFASVPGDPERLLAVARALRDVAGDLAQRTVEVDAATGRATAAWTGPRSLDFRFAASGVAHAVTAAVSGVADLADALGDLAGAADRARHEIEHQAARARAAHERAEARVAVLPPGDPRTEVEREGARAVHRSALGVAEDQRAAYDRVALRVAARIEAVADGAAGVVAHADPARLAQRCVAPGARPGSGWAVLDGWLHPDAGAGPAGLAGTVAGLTSPTAAYSWWQALNPVAQQAVLLDRPGLVANLDGVPAWARDLANRQRLGPLRWSVQDRLRARLAELVAARGRPTAYDAYAGTAPIPLDRDPELHHLTQQLGALTALGVVLARPGRRLLALDVSSGRQVHAAVAVGDVDTADDVAVFTPGLGSNVQDSVADYDALLGDLRDQAAAESDGTGATTAAVAWLDYDAPQFDELLDGSRSVASPQLAQQGAVGLAGFLGGVDASRPHGVHLVALGHSYGSTTTGDALARGRTGVDDVALFGSPGAGPDSVEALHVPPGHLYVESASTDPVATFDHFGAPPERTVGFRALATSQSVVQGRSLAGIRLHSHYLDPGTTSQWNLAAVLLDRRDLMVRAPEMLQPERLRYLW